MPEVRDDLRLAASRNGVHLVSGKSPSTRCAFPKQKRLKEVGVVSKARTFFLTFWPYRIVKVMVVSERHLSARLSLGS